MDNPRFWVTIEVTSLSEDEIRFLAANLGQEASGVWGRIVGRIVDIQYAPPQGATIVGEYSW